jgi:hypothetical protein
MKSTEGKLIRMSVKTTGKILLLYLIIFNNFNSKKVYYPKNKRLFCPHMYTLLIPTKRVSALSNRFAVDFLSTLSPIIINLNHNYFCNKIDITII